MLPIQPSDGGNSVTFKYDVAPNRRSLSGNFSTIFYKMFFRYFDIIKK